MDYQLEKNLICPHPIIFHAFITDIDSYRVCKLCGSKLHYYYGNYDILLKDRENWLREFRKELDILEKHYSTELLSNFSKYLEENKNEKI